MALDPGSSLQPDQKYYEDGRLDDHPPIHRRDSIGSRDSSDSLVSIDLTAKITPLPATAAAAAAGNPLATLKGVSGDGFLLTLTRVDPPPPTITSSTATPVKNASAKVFMVVPKGVEPSKKAQVATFTTANYALRRFAMALIIPVILSLFVNRIRHWLFRGDTITVAGLKYFKQDLTVAALKHELATTLLPVNLKSGQLDLQIDPKTLKLTSEPKKGDLAAQKLHLVADMVRDRVMKRVESYSPTDVDKAALFKTELNRELEEYDHVEKDSEKYKELLTFMNSGKGHERVDDILTAVKEEMKASKGDVKSHAHEVALRVINAEHKPLKNVGELFQEITTPLKTEIVQEAGIAKLRAVGRAEMDELRAKQGLERRGMQQAIIATGLIKDLYKLEDQVDKLPGIPQRPPIGSSGRGPLQWNKREILTRFDQLGKRLDEYTSSLVISKQQLPDNLQKIRDDLAKIKENLPRLTSETFETSLETTKVALSTEEQSFVNNFIDAKVKLLKANKFFKENRVFLGPVYDKILEFIDRGWVPNNAQEALAVRDALQHAIDRIRLEVISVEDEGTIRELGVRVQRLDDIAKTYQLADQFIEGASSGAQLWADNKGNYVWNRSKPDGEWRKAEEHELIPEFLKGIKPGEVYAGSPLALKMRWLTTHFKNEVALPDPYAALESASVEQPDEKEKASEGTQRMNFLDRDTIAILEKVKKASDEDLTNGLFFNQPKDSNKVQATLKQAVAMYVALKESKDFIHPVVFQRLESTIDELRSVVEKFPIQSAALEQAYYESEPSVDTARISFKDLRSSVGAVKAFVPKEPLQETSAGSGGVGSAGVRSLPPRTSQDIKAADAVEKAPSLDARDVAINKEWELVQRDPNALRLRWNDKSGLVFGEPNIGKKATAQNVLSDFATNLGRLQKMIEKQDKFKGSSSKGNTRERALVNYAAELQKTRPDINYIRSDEWYRKLEAFKLIENLDPALVQKQTGLSTQEFSVLKESLRTGLKNGVPVIDESRAKLNDIIVNDLIEVQIEVLNEDWAKIRSDSDAPRLRFNTTNMQIEYGTEGRLATPKEILNELRTKTLDQIDKNASEKFSKIRMHLEYFQILNDALEGNDPENKIEYVFVRDKLLKLREQILEKLLKEGFEPDESDLKSEMSESRIGASITSGPSATIAYPLPKTGDLPAAADIPQPASAAAASVQAAPIMTPSESLRRASDALKQTIKEVDRGAYEGGAKAALLKDSLRRLKEASATFGTFLQKEEAFQPVRDYDLALLKSFQHPELITEDQLKNLHRLAAKASTALKAIQNNFGQADLETDERTENVTQLNGLIDNEFGILGSENPPAQIYKEIFEAFTQRIAFIEIMRSKKEKEASSSSDSSGTDSSGANSPVSNRGSPTPPASTPVSQSEARSGEADVKLEVGEGVMVPPEIPQPSMGISPQLAARTAAASSGVKVEINDPIIRKALQEYDDQLLIFFNQYPQQFIKRDLVQDTYNKIYLPAYQKLMKTLQSDRVVRSYDALRNPLFEQLEAEKKHFEETANNPQLLQTFQDSKMEEFLDVRVEALKKLISERPFAQGKERIPTAAAGSAGAVKPAEAAAPSVVERFVVLPATLQVWNEHKKTLTLLLKRYDSIADKSEISIKLLATVLGDYQKLIDTLKVDKALDSVGEKKDIILKQLEAEKALLDDISHASASSVNTIDKAFLEDKVKEFSEQVTAQPFTFVSYDKFL
jgi:hypothetical protein